MSLSVRGVSGLLLVGGRSRRMGRDKASLELGGVPMAAHGLRLLASLCDEVLLCGARQSALDLLAARLAEVDWSSAGGAAAVKKSREAIGTQVGRAGGEGPRLRLVPDLIPDQGPLGGLQAGLLACQSPYALLLACDMPSLSQGLLRRLLALRGPGVEAVIPRGAGGPEPLAGVYSRALLPRIKARLEAGRRSARGLLLEGVEGASGGALAEAPQIAWLDLDSNILYKESINLNTQDELQQYIKVNH